jgi:hypothetical protein
VSIAIRHAGKKRRVDHLAVMEWLAPIIEQFENDGRPIEIVDLKP